MVSLLQFRYPLGEGRPMLKPMFASIFAIALTLPGCGRETAAPPEPKSPLIGKLAPEIDGSDLDGQSFKLSDYKGKVVAVSFWFDQCVYCRKLFPHEKALVEKHVDHPFALIGANTDPTPEMGKASQDRHSLTWRSVWIGDPEGPVALRWGVTGYPTTFVIDARGVVRYCFIGPNAEGVDRAVSTLLREVPS